MIINGTAETIEELTSTGVVLIDFHAAWCGPCRMLSPIMEDLATEFEGKVTIIKVDADAEQETAIKFEVRSIPDVRILVDGEEVQQYLGSKKHAQYVDKLNELTDHMIVEKPEGD